MSPVIPSGINCSRISPVNDMEEEQIDFENIEELDGLTEAICRGSDDPALNDAVGQAMGAIFQEGVMDKAGKVLAGVALAAGLAHGAINHKAAHNVQPRNTKTCSAVVKNAWNNPKYQELEEKYLQEELQRQQDLVKQGKRKSVDEQGAYEKAQSRAMYELACGAR